MDGDPIDLVKTLRLSGCGVYVSPWVPFPVARVCATMVVAVHGRRGESTAVPELQSLGDDGEYWKIEDGVATSAPGVRTFSGLEGFGRAVRVRIDYSTIDLLLSVRLVPGG